jgi:orotidine-5'-phosphate decarboxylase
LGSDGLRPFLDQAIKTKSGIFALVKTSNPGSAELQDLVADGLPIYVRVARQVESLTFEYGLSEGFGIVGAVVGATFPEQLSELRQCMRHCWILVPGFGAQGGTARDVAAAFLPGGLGALINSSRAILYAHANREYAGRFPVTDWQRAVESATEDAIHALRAETPAGRLGSQIDS